MRVLIAGAGGMLGQDTTAAFASRGHSVQPLARAELDITDAGELAAVSPVALRGVLGRAAATRLSELADGVDERRVDSDRAIKSVSHEETFAHDLHRRDDLRTELARLADGGRLVRRILAAIPDNVQGGAVRVGRTFSRTLGAYFAGTLRAVALPVTVFMAANGAAEDGFKKEHGGNGDVGAAVTQIEMLAMSDLSLMVKAGVQWGLFGGAIETLGTERHHEA